MGNTVFAAIAAGTFGLLVAVVTYVLTKKREHDADWRKAKLEHYREYVAALSGITDRRSTPSTQARYSDAFNALTLVASTAVLTALYAFQDEIPYRNTTRTDEAYDRLLGALLRSMRDEIQPNSATLHRALEIRRMISVPPQDGG